jgi:hypothetical protein
MDYTPKIETKKETGETLHGERVHTMAYELLLLPCTFRIDFPSIASA